MSKNNKAPSRPALSTAYVQMFIEVLADHKIDLGGWLNDVSFDLELLNNLEDFLSQKQLHSLISILPDFWNTPGLGLDLGKKMVLSTNGVLSYAILSSETYLDGVKVFRQFHQLREQIMTFDLVQTEDDVVFLFEMGEVGFHEELSHFCYDAALSGVHTFLKDYLGKTSEINAIKLQRPKPADSEAYTTFFGKDIEFDATENSITIPKSVLDQKAISANKTIAMMATQQCEVMMKDIVNKGDLAEEIYKSLIEAPWHIPSQEEVASQLCMSERTLRRHLKELGTSYKMIQEQARESLAIKFLRETNWSVEEISLFLGFSEKSNFHRSFKRWTGKTPASYRSAKAVA